MLKGSDLYSKIQNIQIFTNVSNAGWGAQLDEDLVKDLLFDREKKLHINILELKAVFLALKQFRDQCQNQIVLIATDNSTVVAFINKQEGTHSVGDLCCPVESHLITLKMISLIIAGILTKN